MDVDDEKLLPSENDRKSLKRKKKFTVFFFLWLTLYFEQFCFVNRENIPTNNSELNFNDFAVALAKHEKLKSQKL